MNTKTMGVLLLIIAILVAGFVFFESKIKTAKTTTSNTNQTTQSSNPCANSPTKDIVLVAKSPTLGNYLADTKCISLYVTSSDNNTEPTCYDTCAQTWMPYLYDNKDLKTLAQSQDLLKRINLLKRKDGSYQYAYGKTPLYYYKNDAQPGDIKGNGLDNRAWSIVLTDKQGIK